MNISQDTSAEWFCKINNLITTDDIFLRKRKHPERKNPSADVRKQFEVIQRSFY